MNVTFYREAYSRECPRTDLDHDNAEAAEILGFLADERLRPLAPAMLAALCVDRTPEERVNVMRRAEAALCDPTVVAIMYPRTDEE